MFLEILILVFVPCTFSLPVRLQFSYVWNITETLTILKVQTGKERTEKRQRNRENIESSRFKIHPLEVSTFHIHSSYLRLF